MNIIKTKVSKVFDKVTKKPILEIGLRIEIEKIIDIKKNLGTKALNEVFDGLLAQIKKECNC
jgi:hypothetical protein